MMPVRNFSAHLYRVEHGSPRPVGITPESVPWGGGWLEQLNEGKPPALFDFLLEAAHPETNRFHYYIRVSDRIQARYSRYKLALSRNGYLGVYQTPEFEQFWKLEPLSEWQDNQMLCTIRDHQGHEVCYEPLLNGWGEVRENYLRVQGGVTSTFLITRV